MGITSTHLNTRLSFAHSCPCSTPDLHYTSCPHYRVYPSTPGTYLDWVVDSGAPHHVIIDLATLALHAPYSASNNVINGNGSSLLIANIGSFSLTSLPTPFFFIMSYMRLPCLRILFRSRLFMLITLLMSYSLTLSFRCKIITWGSPWFAGSVETVSNTGRSQSPFIL